MSNDVENPKNADEEERFADEVTWYCIGQLHQVSVYSIAAGYCISAFLLVLSFFTKLLEASTALNYFISAAAILICVSLNLIKHDRLDLMKMLRLIPAAVLFNLSQFTCIELLLHANVDNFIFFRSSVPIFVAIAEALYSYRPWPTTRKWVVSLATFFAGSVVYVMTGYKLTPVGFGWGLGYLISISVYFVNYKHVCMKMGLNSWGFVLYNNLEALLLCPLELLIIGEFRKMESTLHSFLPVGLSCLFGLAICLFGFSFSRGSGSGSGRGISAAGFTVLGIVSKLLTVVINLVIWYKHSTIVGAVGILISMIGGALYAQSVRNKPKAEKQVQTQAVDRGKQKLLEMVDS